MEESAIRLVRPKAVRAGEMAPSAPQSSAELFYQEVNQRDIPLSHIHRGVADSHDWQRKWDPTNEQHNEPQRRIHQDNVNCNYEYGYDVPEDDDKNALIPSSYAYQGIVNPRENTGGAHNPSPQEEHYKRPRDPPTSTMLNDLARGQHARQQRAVSPDYDMRGVEDDLPSIEQQNPRLVKPVALRVTRPVAVRTVPRHVMLNFSSILGSSPLTVPSVPSEILSLYHEASSGEESFHVIEEDEPDESGVPANITTQRITSRVLKAHVSTAVRDARDGLLEALATGKEPQDDTFQLHLAVLKEAQAAKQVDARLGTATHGMWLTLTKPNFFGCLGENDQGDPMYTLGRMTFDMFSPTDLVCSLQGNFNSVERVVAPEEIAFVPKALLDEVAAGTSLMRTYNVVTAFTIEPDTPAYPDAPNKDVRRPIRGIMTTYGYTLPDPDTPSRLSVWITGGRIEPNDQVADQDGWRSLFEKHPHKHEMVAQVKFMALKWLMGAEMDSTMASDGSFEYNFSRPIGGHGMAYVDTLYVDESLRIVQGHRGTIFVFSRMR